MSGKWLEEKQATNMGIMTSPTHYDVMHTHYDAHFRVTGDVWPFVLTHNNIFVIDNQVINMLVQDTHIAITSRHNHYEERKLYIIYIYYIGGWNDIILNKLHCSTCSHWRFVEQIRDTTKLDLEQTRVSPLSGLRCRQCEIPNNYLHILSDKT